MEGTLKSFKESKVGVIPFDWDAVKLGEATVLLTNGFVGKAKEHYSVSSDAVLYIQGFNVTENSFNLTGIRRVSKEFHDKHQKSCLKEDDLLTVQTGDIGLTTIVPKKLEGSNCHALVISRFKKETYVPAFYCQYFNSHIGRSRLRRIETGTTMKHLNVGDMKSWYIPVPPPIEQRKISEILSTWDEAIELTQKLIDQLKLRKKGLMQQLLTGKKRLSGYAEEIEKVRLWGLIKQVNERNKTLSVHRVLSVTNSRGFINQSEHFDREVASKDLSNYKIVSEGQFAFNPSRVNVGSLDLLKDFECGLLSPMYVVFKVDSKKLLPDYLFYLLNSWEFTGRIPQYTQGSVRDSLGFDGLESMSFFIPGLEEQKAIVQILNALDEEILLQTKYLGGLQLQKKGLMQQLLTGKIRVPLTEAS